VNAPTPLLDRPARSYWTTREDAILREAFEAADLGNAPWHYWNERCARTVCKLAPGATLKRAGTKHHALDDCEHPARCVQAALLALRGSEAA